jgi:hypothetical protein
MDYNYSDPSPVEAQPRYIPVGLTKAQWRYLLDLVKDSKEALEILLQVATTSSALYDNPATEEEQAALERRAKDVETLQAIHTAIRAALISFKTIH